MAVLPKDSLAGVECAVDVIRATIDEAPQPLCGGACGQCSLGSVLDRVSGLVMKAVSVSSAKACRRKLLGARRAAGVLKIRFASLKRRGCIGPANRVVRLASEVTDLAERTQALFQGGFCVNR